MNGIKRLKFERLKNWELNVLKIIKAALILIVIGLLLVPGLFAAKKETAAVLSRIRGTAHIKRAASKKWFTAKAGAFLYANDTIRTRPRSRAIVSFSNGVETKLYSNTVFRIEDKKASKKAEGNKIKLMLGRLWTKVLRKKTKFEIKTPIATIAVRGTEYETGVEKSGKTNVKVFSGTVEVSNKYGSKKVNKNSKTTVDPGSPPADPVPLGDDDQSTWQNDVKTTGSVEMKLSKETTYVKEIVEGAVTIYDEDGKKNKDSTESIELTSDNKNLKFSESGKAAWKTSVELVPEKGEVIFDIKSDKPGTFNLSASSKNLGASMASIYVKLFPRKTLKVKIKDAEGKQKELKLNFETK